MPGSRAGAASSATEWAGWVNDDGDFGPRVEGISRARARRPGAGRGTGPSGARQRGRTVTSKSLGRQGSGRASEAPRANPRARHQKHPGLPAARQVRDRARRSRHGSRRRTRPLVIARVLEQKTGQKRRGPDEPGLTWTLSLPRLPNTSPYIATKTRRVAYLVRPAPRGEWRSEVGVRARGYRWTSC